MLLTIDLGNTSAKFAIFDGDQQICFLNIDSKQDDYTAIIKNFLYRNNLKEDLIEDVIISSVVPNISKVLEKVILNVFNKEAIFISPTNDYGIKIETENVEEVGSDLLVMCAYAYHLFKQELLVVSLGTASVICHVDNEGSFKHCIISPGYGKIAETLWGNAAKLPEFELKRTLTFLANNTIDAMNVGIYQGYIGTIRYLLTGIKAELNKEPKIVACGGFGKEIVKDIKEIEYYEADMVTSGLHYIYNRYIKNEINTGI